METSQPFHQRLLHSKYLSRLVIALTLVILGGTVTFGALQLRKKIREQMVKREGEILCAVALMQYFSEPPDDKSEPIDNLLVALEASRLPHKDVLSVRLFDARGVFIDAFPFYLDHAGLEAKDLLNAKRFEPATHYYGKARLADFLGTSAVSAASDS